MDSEIAAAATVEMCSVVLIFVVFMVWTSRCALRTNACADPVCNLDRTTLQRPVMLLRFVVGSAVRTAARVAVNSHRQARAEQQAAIAAARMAGPFAFQVTPDGETGIFLDRRIGFGHAIPGFPRPMTPQGGPSEPPCEAMIGLCEVPVAIRYRLDRPQLHARDAGDFASRLAHAYAAGRTPHPPAIELARGDRLASWRVEAAALAHYPLPYADPWGADYEELIVQVLQATSMTVTIRYPRALRESDWLRKALLSSALYASLCWDPQRPAHYVPQIWPQSAFLEAGLSGALKPHPQSVVAQLAPSMPQSSQEREAISSALGAIIEHDAPPWHPLSPDERARNAASLCACSSSEAFHAVVQRGLGETQTMHDLRGFAIMLGRALT